MPEPATGALAELRLLGALHVLGLAQSWDFPPVADRALANGLYSPSIAELAAAAALMSDVAPLLERAFGELGLSLPSSRADAAWMIARHCMERLVSTTERPFDILCLLRAASIAASDVLPDDKYVGDGLDLGSLIGLYWSFTDPDENHYALEDRIITDEKERQALLDSLARREARAWLERHPQR